MFKTRLLSCVCLVGLGAVCLTIGAMGEHTQAHFGWFLAAGAAFLGGGLLYVKLEQEWEAAQVLRQRRGLTVNEVVEEAGRTAAAHGWHEVEPTITEDSPLAQLAALAPVLLDLGAVVEALRKHPLDSTEVGEAIEGLKWTVNMLASAPRLHLSEYLRELGEDGGRMQGSRVEALARILLIVSEAAEQAEAVEKGDLENFLEEAVDQWIRHGDCLWYMANVAPPAWALKVIHEGDIPAAEIANIERWLLSKMERNRRRTYRHGGKRA